MPVGRSFDITLNGKGYMLARGQFKGRAWRRTGQANAVQPRNTDADLQRNALPPELDFVAVYDDFSGGYGDAYRSAQVPNRIHWAENFELRFPDQAIHCQQPKYLQNQWNPSGSLSGATGLSDNNAAWLQQVPPIDTEAGIGMPGPVGRGTVVLYAHSGPFGWVEAYTPTGLIYDGVSAATVHINEFDRIEELSTGSGVFAFGGRAALFGSFAWAPGAPEIQPQFRRRDLNGIAGMSMTLSPMNGAVMAVAGNRLWRAHGQQGNHVSLLQSCAITDDPMGTANWSATLHLGNGQVDIQDMIALDDQLFASTQDGLYAGDTTGTFFNVLGDMGGQTHPDNGRNITIHDRGIAYPSIGGVILYQQLANGAVARDIGPNDGSQRSPLRGHPRALVSYGGWLYAGMYTGSQSYLVAGRDRGDGIFSWSPLQRVPVGADTLPAGAVHQIMVDSISAPSGGGNLGSANIQMPPRFWLTTEHVNSGDSVNAPVFYWQIPASDGNPLGAAYFSANYANSARMDLGRDNRGAPDTLKVLRRLDVNTDANTFLSGYRYCDVSYMLDGGPRVFLGRAQTSPRTTLYFPSGQGSFTMCYDFELSLDSTAVGSYNIATGLPNSGSPTPLCPVYRSFVVHGAFLAEGADEITAVFDISDRRANRHGTPMRSASAQLTELRSLPGGSPVRLIDLTGAQNWVSVQRSIDEVETYQEGSDEPEVAATVRLSVLRFS